MSIYFSKHGLKNLQYFTFWNDLPPPLYNSYSKNLFGLPNFRFTPWEGLIWPPLFCIIWLLFWIYFGESSVLLLYSLEKNKINKVLGHVTMHENFFQTLHYITSLSLIPQFYHWQYNVKIVQMIQSTKHILKWLK
jgi:hypothetical protein